MNQDHELKGWRNEQFLSQRRSGFEGLGGTPRPKLSFPGRMLNLLGGGSGPLYTGFSEKEKIN